MASERKYMRRWDAVDECYEIYEPFDTGECTGEHILGQWYGDEPTLDAILSYLNSSAARAGEEARDG